MPISNATGVSISYEMMGSASAPPLVLIAGVCTPRDGWPEGFCRQLADAGHHVIRFDHRDTGESATLDHLPVPNLDDLAGGLAETAFAALPYTLAEMVHDVVGVMDAVGLEKAHICGISMGGMIGQLMAMNEPGRVLSLVSMASTTGEPTLPPASSGAREALMKIPPEDRDGFLDCMVEIQQAFAGGSLFFDSVVQREMSARALDRGGSPAAFARQMAAIITAPGRRQALGMVRVPTLVIHGRRDPLFSMAHGRDTATSIPDAVFHIIDEWGHGMAYPALWPEMMQAITDHTHALDPGLSGLHGTPSAFTNQSTT